MKWSAVICDVYGTLLDLGPPPADGAARWQQLWRDTWAMAPRLSLADFQAQTARVVAARQERARGYGIAYPEVYWPEVVRMVVPELASADPARAAHWEWAHVGLLHTVRLRPGVAPVLRAWHAQGARLGVASNAQPYTVREVGEALAAAGLGWELFDPRLVFWSWEHGFSKPDPHVFRLLGARLAAFGIRETNTLMVGDRLDHDVRPAQAQGWRAWLLTPPGAAGPPPPPADGPSAGAGDWAALARAANVAVSIK